MSQPLEEDYDAGRALTPLHDSLTKCSMWKQLECDSLYNYGEIARLTSDIIARTFSNVQSVVLRGVDLEDTHSLFWKRLPYSFAISLLKGYRKDQHLTFTHIFDNCVSEFRVDLSCLLWEGLLQSMVSLNHSQNLYPFLWHELAKDKFKCLHKSDKKYISKDKSYFLDNRLIVCQRLESLVLKQRNDFQDNPFNSIKEAPLIFPRLKYMEVSKFSLSAQELASLPMISLLHTFVYTEKLPKMQLIAEVDLSKLDTLKLTPILTNQSPLEISEGLNQIFAGRSKIPHVEAMVDISEYTLDFSHLNMPDVTHLTIVGNQDALNMLKCASKMQRLKQLDLSLNCSLSLTHLTSTISVIHTNISSNHSVQSITIKSKDKNVKDDTFEIQEVKKNMKKVFPGLKSTSRIF
ncbi:hypothetical protein IWW36_002716 [Coemansia brasiliensis]|uniref:Uncharacterized protein n=1 Tax=Coemansia brasiliensis TaxID=2650707 RepID=A0A9W8ICY2_9FUNG|nr:hypothetical protein IWW36_002716 [Coemansia brasiliensis]